MFPLVHVASQCYVLATTVFICAQRRPVSEEGDLPYTNINLVGALMHSEIVRARFGE